MIADDAEAIAKRLRELNPKFDALAPLTYKKWYKRLVFEISEEDNRSPTETWLSYIRTIVDTKISAGDKKLIGLKVIEEERLE